MDSRLENFVRLIGVVSERFWRWSMMELLGTSRRGSKSTLMYLNPSEKFRKLNKKGEMTVIDLKYERLPTFCYECGIMDT